MTIDPDEAYYEALYRCCNRYAGMGASSDGRLNDVRSFIDEFEQAIKDRAPLHKLCRWLGYIQGVFITLQITDVETERNWTRPFFRPLDYPLEDL